MWGLGWAPHARQSCDRGYCLLGPEPLATAGAGTWVFGPALIHSAHGHYLSAGLSLALRGTVLGMAKWFDWESLCNDNVEQCAFTAGFAMMGFVAVGVAGAASLDVAMALKPTSPPKPRVTLRGTGPFVAGKSGGLGWGLSGVF